MQSAASHASTSHYRCRNDIFVGEKKNKTANATSGELAQTGFQRSQGHFHCHRETVIRFDLTQFELITE